MNCKYCNIKIVKKSNESYKTFGKRKFCNRVCYDKSRTRKAENSYKSNEHRRIMEAYVGRKLSFNELVHHKDEDKRNNELSNLEIMTRQQHNDYHLRKYPNDKTCVICGETFTPHKTKRKRNKVCSQDCRLKLLKEKAAIRKIPIIQLDLKGNFVKDWDCGKTIENEKGWSQSNIVNCCKGKIPTAYGFIWKYKLI